MNEAEAGTEVVSLFIELLVEMLLPAARTLEEKAALNLFSTPSTDNSFTCLLK